MAGSDDANMTAQASAASPAAPTASTTTHSTPSDSAALAASNAAPHDDGDAEVVTLREVLHDVLREESEFNDAAAVLGDASDDHCSYDLGYFRQPLYACLTCTPGPLDANPANVAGVCLACSYHCHADHELVELYTKRDFRCDCGNARFPATARCTLVPDKAPVNDRNVYSQNFVGTYCTCARPYPDPERTTPEIMVQCVVCEDWLHEEHLFEATATDGRAAARLPESFAEMVCRACMTKHAFLQVYQLLEEQDEGEEEEVEADGDGEEREAGANDRNDGQEEKIKTTETPTLPSSSCVLETLQQQQQQQQLTKEEDATERDAEAMAPTFWSHGWRARLCTCSKCVARMEREKIAFLLDPEDTLEAYDERTKQHQAMQQQEAGTTTTTTTTSTTSTTTTTGTGNDVVVTSSVQSAMSTMEQAAERAMMSKLSHEQQVEVAVGYRDMKQKLQSYLESFAAADKTVRPEDIQGFFQELRESKRPRRN